MGKFHLSCFRFTTISSINVDRGESNNTNRLFNSIGLILAFEVITCYFFAYLKIVFSKKYLHQNGFYAGILVYSFLKNFVNSVYSTKSTVRLGELS